MGIRSMNYLALKQGMTLPPEVARFYNPETAEIISDASGTLIIFESNITPMWARDGKGTCCTLDLESEVALHAYLGQQAKDDFRLVRAGEETDSRGRWFGHPFQENPEVQSIEQTYTKNLAEEPVRDSHAIFEVRFAVSDLPALRAYAETRELDVDSPDMLADVLTNPDTAPLDAGYEILRKRVRNDGPQMVLEVLVRVFNEARLVDEAQNCYEACWQDASWRPETMEEALYEVLVASNESPSPNECGYELVEMTPVTRHLLKAN